MKNAFRSVMAVLALSLALACIACGAEEEKEGVAGIVQELYESDYEFQKTESRYLEFLDAEGELIGEEGLVTTAYEGKVCADPLEQYMRVVEESGESAWSERYLVEDGSGMTVSTRDAGGEIVTQKLGKAFPDFPWKYPYGYGKGLTFTRDREEELDGILCDVYTAEYEETVSFGDRASLEATVFQEYYIDQERQQVVMIRTDLEDYYAKEAALYYANAQGITAEEAFSKTAEAGAGAEDIYRIFHYNEDIEIEPLR